MADSNKPIVPGGDTVGTVGEVYLSKNGKTYECVAVIDNTTVTPNGETIPRVEYVWVCTDDGAGGGTFPFDVSDAEPITISHTKEELIAAIDAGKTPIGYWLHTQSNGTVIRLFHFVKRFNATDGINLTFYFSDKTSSGVLDIRADGTIKRTYQHNDGGGASGSANFTFTITPTNGPGIQMLSVTRAEMLAALDSGKTLLGYWTETKTILETIDTIKHEFRLESVSGTGASRGLAFVNYEQFYKSTLYVNGNDTVSFVDKEVLPAPMTKTEAMTQSVGMDDDGRLWTEPGTSGGGGVQPDWNQNDDTQPDYIKNKPLIVISFKPAGKSYLTFSSPNSFTLKINDATKHWNGTLEYFASDRTWTVWDGTTTLSAVADDGEYVLYLRGTGNTVITGYSTNYKWVLTGTDVKCNGNIENLLDYATVQSGVHPTMASNCYRNMFNSCTSLTQAPALPASTLAEYCYMSMFQGCTSLTQAPALPASTLAEYCYINMFQGCTALTQAPNLPATTLKDECYRAMFQGCTALTQVPALSATTLANSCYRAMFQGCTALTQVPALSATTLANSCYSNMFNSCTSLTQAPALPATTLAESCYSNMFNSCTSLAQAPALPATTLAEYCYMSMFQGCTSLPQAPALPATTLANYCYISMFQGCTSLTQAPNLPATTLKNECYRAMFQGCTALTQAPNLPATTLKDECYRNMFYRCTSIKLSSTQTGEYTQEYRIPSYGDGVTVSGALSTMFSSTGGTFTGTPEVNKTYYLSSDNMIVRGTEVATLNGYVGAMIAAKAVAYPSAEDSTF